MKSPCYLETSNPVNVDIYKKYDFIQVHEFEKFNIKTFCLYREPKIIAKHHAGVGPGTIVAF